MLQFIRITINKNDDIIKKKMNTALKNPAASV